MRQSELASAKGAIMATVSSTYLSIHLHLIFATKDRAPMIEDRWRNDLHGYLAAAFRGQGLEVPIVGGVADHVHALVQMNSRAALGEVLREVKRQSSVWAVQHYHRFAWQTGYAAFSVGASERTRTLAYIANQEEHHRVKSSADELRELLAEHEVEFDDRYFS